MSEATTENAQASDISDGPEPSATDGVRAPWASGRLTGGLALLLVLAALVALGGGLGGWQYYQSEYLGRSDKDDTAARLDKKVAALEARLSTQQTTALQSLDDSLRGLRQHISRVQSDSQTSFDQLQSMVQAQRQRLLELASTDPSDWMLAEAQYLLRLANQRLIMAADKRSAVALLGAADDILKELDDAELYAVRQSVARDLAALRALPELDVEGTGLRIQALVGQIDTLRLFEIPVIAEPEQPVAEDASLEQRLRSSVEAAIDKLSSYVVIRRRQAPYESLISPQWEGMVRQNLRMLLEQGRAALLSGNQLLYRQSIDNARHWLAEFFSFSEKGVAALDQELADLAQIEVRQQLPDISGSVAAIKAAIHRRHRVEPAQ